MINSARYSRPRANLGVCDDSGGENVTRLNVCMFGVNTNEKRGKRERERREMHNAIKQTPNEFGVYNKQKLQQKLHVYSKARAYFNVDAH